MQGAKKSQEALSREEVRKLCAFTYNPKVIEPYKTIHFRGLKRSKYATVWKVFSYLGIDTRKVKHLDFVNIDTLEIVLIASYVDELTNILENAHKKELFRELVMKKISFDPLSSEHIRNPNITYTAEEIFKRRMARKLENIQKMKVNAPHLVRLEKYVKKQIASNTLDITMPKPLNYEFTMAEAIDDQLKQAMAVSHQETKNFPMKLIIKWK